MLYCSLLEKGDTIFTFEGDKKKCPLKIVLKVQNPQFYWKVCTLTLCWNYFIRIINCNHCFKNWQDQLVRPVQSKLNINPVQFLLKTKNCIKNRKNRKSVVQPGNSKAGMAEPVLERFCLTSKKKHTFSLKSKKNEKNKNHICLQRERERKKEIETEVDIRG